MAGYKPTIEADERRHGARTRLAHAPGGTIDPPTKEEFDLFWDAQHGVRGLFLMDELAELPAPVAFKVYGRALERGYPIALDYRYLRSNH